jgi:hypothetical protein
MAFGPAARAVVHAGDFDCRPANSIGDDVGRFRDYEFARSGDATGIAELGVLREKMLDAIDDVQGDALRGGRIMFGCVRAVN